MSASPVSLLTQRTQTSVTGDLNLPIDSCRHLPTETRSESVPGAPDFCAVSVYLLRRKLPGPISEM